MANPNSDIIIEYIKKYPQAQKLTLAKLIFLENPGKFKDVETIRSIIRYHHDQMGNDNRLREKAFVADEPGKRKLEENIETGTSEIEFDSQTEIRTLDELIERCNIDVNVWKISKYVQNYWGNRENPNWQVKVWLAKKNEEQLFQDAFTEFLQSYNFKAEKICRPVKNNKPKANLIINKQDAHLNKFDVNGNNDINRRFDNIKDKIKIILQQAALSNYIENITYILGSDEFNSEWNGMTTKGTPQTNVGTFQSSYELICNHNITMINLMLKHAERVNIVFVPGNHDEFAGWHLVNWLQAYYRSNSRIHFDIEPKYRKYVSYGNSALMFNHGDAIKPAKLAAMFPIEYKDRWSEHEYYYIFCGDKHHELSHDFNGIKFYQLPSFSSARSLWDEKNGYTCSKPEATGFLVEESSGITNIFKQYL